MNCKQGDLARVISTLGTNYGKIVRCVSFIPAQSFTFKPDQYSDPEPGWVVDPPLMGTWGGQTNKAPDRLLRPIRDPGEYVTDEMVKIAGKPHEVTA